MNATFGRPRIAIVTETFAPEINGVAHTLKQVTQRLTPQCDIQVIRPAQSAEITASAKPAITIKEGIQYAKNPQKQQQLQQPIIQILVKGLPIPAYPELRFGIPCRRQLETLWQRHTPAAIYVATQGPLGWSALGAARKLKIPIVSGFHTNFHRYSHYYGMGWLQQLVQKYLKHFHNRTHFTLLPTHQVAEEAAAMGISNGRACSRGVDTHQFHPRHRCDLLRQSWGADKQTPVLIYVGRLANEKNVMLAITAFKRIQQQAPESKMVMVGSGPLEATIASRHADIILAGVKRDAELAACYASADIFLFPSETETFGNVILEAIASGLALVSYNLAAASHYLTNNESAMLAPPGNEDQFCQLALELVTRPAELSRIRKNTESVCRSMGWQAIANQFLNFLLLAGSEEGKYEIQPGRRSVQIR